jgi:hypothetical protein
VAGCALYINEKVLKCRCPKWARIAHLDIWNTSYGQKKARESNSRDSASFDSRPLKVGNRLEILGCKKTCDIPLERSRQDLQLFFRRWVDRRSALKVMKLQSRRSPENARFRDSHVGVPEVPGQNGHLDATPATSHRVYYKGKVVASPKVRAVVSLVCPCCPWLVPTPKGSRMSYNHFVWFHAGPCEWVSLSILPSLSWDF